MLRLTLALLVARSSALALQPMLARSAAVVRSATAVRSAASMQFDWDATRDAEEKTEEERHAALLAHLRRPIRQYEGGWGDRALRGGGVDDSRIGKGPTPHVKDDGDDPLARGGKGDVPTLPPEKQAQLVLPEESFKVEKMEMSQTDEDFVMECALDKGEMEAEMFIDIEPMFLTKEEYFYGFTADSDPKISIEYGMSSDIEGEMNPKDHNAARGKSTLGSLQRDKDQAKHLSRVMIKLKFNPEFEAGEFNAYLCFIFPNEKAFSKFYKITGKSKS